MVFPTGKIEIYTVGARVACLKNACAARAGGHPYILLYGSNIQKVFQIPIADTQQPLGKTT